MAAPRVALPDAPAHAVVPPAPPASEGAPRAARHAAYPAVVRPPPSMAPGAMSSIEAAARRAAGGLRYGAAAGEAPPAADQVPPHGRAQAVPPPSAQEVPPPRELDAAQLAMLAPRGAAVIEADAAPLYGDVRPASGGAAADGVDDYPGGAGAVGAPAAYPVAVGPVRAHPVHASDAAADSARAAIDAAEARAAAAADGRAVVAHDAESLSLEDISAQFAEAVRLAGSVLFGGQGKVEEDEDVDGEGAEVLAPAPDDIKLLSLPEWEDDGGGVFGRYDVRCKVCKKTFGLLTSHKHHCRNCGALGKSPRPRRLLLFSDDGSAVRFRAKHAHTKPRLHPAANALDFTRYPELRDGENHTARSEQCSLVVGGWHFGSTTRPAPVRAWRGLSAQVASSMVSTDKLLHIPSTVCGISCL